MSPFFKDLLIQASEGLPMVAATVAQRYGVTIPSQILEKLPLISEKIPVAIQEYQNRGLTGAEKAAANVILNLPPEELRRGLSILFGNDQLAGLARATIEGMFAASASITPATET